MSMLWQFTVFTKHGRKTKEFVAFCQGAEDNTSTLELCHHRYYRNPAMIMGIAYNQITLHIQSLLCRE